VRTLFFIRVEHAEIELRRRKSRLRRLAIPLDGRGDIFRHALPFLIVQREIELAGRIARSSLALDQIDRLLDRSIHRRAQRHRGKKEKDRCHGRERFQRRRATG
jgi:hypothetical protein